MQYSNPTDITESSHDEDDGKWGQGIINIESQGEQETTLNSDPVKRTKSTHQHSEVSVYSNLMCGKGVETAGGIINTIHIET